MAEKHVVVWDLETVPDLRASARALGVESASDAEVRKLLGAEFPKLPLHRIVCIGALIATRLEDGWQIDAIGAPHVGDRSEAELISAFVERIAELRPQLVTYNGNSFDLPVLRYRAIINRVSAPGLYARPYFHRYSDDALDLCDVLASYGTGKVSLDQISKIVGLSGKPTGLDGSQVDALVSAGRIQEVAQYCETDVLNTFRLWLLYELFRGAITSKQLAWSEAQILQTIRSRKQSNPHLLTGIGVSSQ